jgi:hypothetical protein
LYFSDGFASFVVFKFSSAESLEIKVSKFCFRILLCSR